MIPTLEVVVIPVEPVVHCEVDPAPAPPLAVELIVTWPVEPEMVMFEPATIEVTIPVKFTPEPENVVAVIVPPVKFPEASRETIVDAWFNEVALDVTVNVVGVDPL